MKKIFNVIISDKSTTTLIISNFAVVCFAIIQNWDLITLIWIYWWQSIIIGFFNVIKILSLKNFSSKGVYFGKVQLTTTIYDKIFVAICFVILYGSFHFLYGLIIFLFTNFTFVSDINSYCIFSGSVLFFINHLFSFLYNKKKDIEKQNIGKIAVTPFLRIIPMQLIIMAGFALIIKFGDAGVHTTLLCFFLLKIGVDVWTHLIEHKVIKFDIRKLRLC